MSLHFRRPLWAFFVLIAGLGAFSTAVQAKLDFIASFQQPNNRMDIVIGTSNETNAKAPLLGITEGKVRNSFSPEPAGWAKLIELVAAAARTQTSDNSWTVTGELSETNTSDVTHIVVSAGPGIRFALNSPKGASLTFYLPATDIPRLQQALDQVKQAILPP